MKRKIFNPKTILRHLLTTVYQMVTFILLLGLYLLTKTITTIINQKYFPSFLKSRLLPFINSFYRKLSRALDFKRSDSISRIDLIELSVRNMRAKKARTIVTIGGMTIGIGAIVFLVSLGYGLQELVVTRVARLEEMKQADITPQAGGKLKINDKTLADFNDIASIEMSLPLIAVVGRVNYQNSVSDLAVYGVTSEYLKQSATKLVQGRIFDSNELTTDTPATGEVAGVSAENLFADSGEKIQEIDFTINPGAWIRVREDTSTSAKILGFTKRVEGNSTGVEFWGGSYLADDGAGQAGQTESGQKLGKWIKAPVLLWKEQACNPETQGDCEDGQYAVMRDQDNKQVQAEGYFAEINLELSGVNIRTPQVLGISSEEPESTNSANNALVDWVEIASEAGVMTAPETKTVALADSAKRQAVVNRAMLKILGIAENEAVGKSFNVSFVVVGDLLADETEKIESASSEYTIIGVIPEEKTPVFYVPFIDLRSLGVNNYSQVKLVVKDQAELAKVRHQVEAMGYVTRSVADTVDQINSLFATARTVLMLLGMVALSVAALGMFNTLTVSLLERTREVGLMKAMGMKSWEVQELFLTESMLMGFLGGLLGIIVGFITGKLVGMALSFFAIFKGVGYVDISYVPLSFVIVIIFLSLLVGIVTGIYPAKRATKISALNALRYE